MLEPLNNTIAISLDEEQPSGNVIARSLEWEGSRASATLGSDNNISTVDDDTQNYPSFHPER